MNASDVDWHALSPQALWTAQQIAFRETLGWTRKEIAAHLGMSRADVTALMSALRRELRRQVASS